MSEEKKNEEGGAETPENQPAENKKVSDEKVGDSVEKKEESGKKETAGSKEEPKKAAPEEKKKAEEPAKEVAAEEKKEAPKEKKEEKKAVAEEKKEEPKKAAPEEKKKAEEPVKEVAAEEKKEAAKEKKEEKEAVAEEREEAPAKKKKERMKPAAEAKSEELSDDESDEETEEVEEEFVPDDAPHDEFDWELGNNYELPYSESEVESMLETYDNSLTTLEEGEVVKGRVKAIHDGDVILDMNYKSDGLVSMSEFRESPDLGPGDEVDVYVEQKEDDRGQLVLSRRKAKLLKAWEAIVDSYKNGTVIRGKVVSKTKGGLIADCGGLETFLPGSQIDIKPIIDYDSYVGKTMDFKVVKINEMIKNAVVSHKALIESDLAEQRDQIISGLEKGQVLEGVVKNLTDFGAFMDLGGVDGLLYITDISWGRINHPSEVLSLNDQVNVVVLDFDENKKRISLGLKQLQPHPWDVVGENIKEGTVVKGKIVNIEDYGAFLEIEPGVEGLIHVSEVSWSNQPVNAREYFKLGEEMEAMVVTIDHDDRKMSLSIKKLTEDPWSKIEEMYPVGSRHKGEVKNLTPYGVFVELEEGIGGMVHISDLSWTKRFSHPSEFTKVGETIDIVILEIDKSGRKLSLGHKQIEENPWDTFQTVFPVGSYHEATIIRKDDRGAIVQLPYGLEAFAPIKHIRKEDNTMAEVEEVLTVKVIEFNANDKRILVSHLRYLEDIQREAKDEVRKEKQKEEKQTRQEVKQTQKKVERTTLGELGVLSQLKESLEGEDRAKEAAKAKEEAKADKAEGKPAAKAKEEPKADKAEEKPEAKAEEESKADKAEEKPEAKAEEESKADKAEEKPEAKAKEESKADKAEEKPEAKAKKESKADKVEEKPEAKAKKESKADKAEEKPEAKAKEETKADKAEEKPAAKAKEEPKADKAEEKSKSKAKKEDPKEEKSDDDEKKDEEK